MGYKLNFKRVALFAFCIALVILMLRGCVYSCGKKENTRQNEDPDAEFTISVYIAKEGVVREMDLEEYIVGVTAAEMPASFEPEALKAQAVAARTFAARHIAALGGSACGKSGADICTDSTCCQAWCSDEAMRDKWGENYKTYQQKIVDAVKATAGEVITYDGALIEALYHSTSGGMTEDSQNVFSAARPYLVAVESPGEESAPRFKRTVEISLSQFVKKVNADFPDAKLSAKKLKSQVEVVSRYESGRVKSVRLGGATATGKQLRKTLSLDSANFSFAFGESSVSVTTIGFGHGVGMSQLGANAMASGGDGYVKILTHYYTGTAIVKISSLEK